MARSSILAEYARELSKPNWTSAAETAKSEKNGKGERKTTYHKTQVLWYDRYLKTESVQNLSMSSWGDILKQGSERAGSDYEEMKPSKGPSTMCATAEEKIYHERVEQKQWGEELWEKRSFEMIEHTVYFLSCHCYFSLFRECYCWTFQALSEVAVIMNSLCSRDIV